LTSQVDLNPGTFTTYNWLKNDIIINFTNRVLTATSEGIYQVDLTNSFGCTNSDKTEVLNECIPKIVGPNAFRPGNAVNAMSKEFFVYSFFITDNFEVAIFNRWGELVFSDTKKDFRWNGGYGNNPGQPAPGGTYSYVIKYQSSFRPEEGIKEQRGGIVLLR
jgi:gliding motility-associated-like protein